MRLTLKEIIQATGAKVIKGENLEGKFTFSTDTRTIQKGEIYLPLKGENFDGEKFIDKALEMGAVGYFCTTLCPPLEGGPKSIDFEEGEQSDRLYSSKALGYAQNLRKNLTNAEAYLWSFLKNKQLNGYKFRKQSPIGNYIVDFVCFERKLIIELDGGHHTEENAVKYDNDRAKFLSDTGYKTLRIFNSEIFNNIDGVLHYIAMNLVPSPKSEISTLPQGVGKTGANLILQVENTLTAYLELARFYKRKINPTTVAITGSSGKTTTKEMAYCIAKESFKTHKSELNFNNEVGLCKTILSMPEDTQVLILEMGMRGLGEIELLSKYSEPDITIIANVGTAHIGRLGSRENIAQAKCEINKYLKENGTLIAHDDNLIKKMIYVCHQEFNINPIYFSLENTKILERSIGYSKFEYKNNQYELNIEGDYNIQNSLAVIEMGLKLGMNPSTIATGLKKYSPIEKRWEIQEIKGFKIINDSYNANPESMQGVIKTVLDVYSPPLLFVLGNMGELGEKEIEYHQEIGEFLLKKLGDFKSRNVEILTVGSLANEISEILNKNGIPSKNFGDNLQTSRYILDNVKIGTTIVFKASRSMKFEEIIQQVKSER